MSDRIYLVCGNCNEKRVIAKRFTLQQGWRFFFAPKDGIEMINADSEQELEAQIDVGGLNCKEKVTLVKVAAFSQWLKKHSFCDDFSIEVEA